MLDFRIETFLCVCRCMNYTKAAEELKITQPGVSQHIRYLESYYGCKLFFYSSKTLRLTPAGEALKRAMLSVKHDDLHLKNLMATLTTQKVSLTFGATLTIGEFFIPQRLCRYIKNHPTAKTEMIIDNTDMLLELLDSGKIDFALIEGHFPKSEYESLVVARENFVAVCGSNYPIGTITDFSDLFNHRLLVREEGSGNRGILEFYLSGNGYGIRDFKAISVVNNIHTLKQMAEANCGITFLYEIAALEELDKGTLQRIKIPDFQTVHDFRFVWRKHSIYQSYYKDICRELCGTIV